MVPHFGYKGNAGYSEVIKHKLSYVVTGFTVVSTVAVLIALAMNGKWLALFTGIVAASPDALGIYNWLVFEKYGRRAQGWLKLVHVQFHRRMQWCERPWGVVVESLFTLGLSWILLALI